MTPLMDIEDRPFALDARISLERAAQLRAPAAAYSLWPDAPFGASADVAVWPSIFTERNGNDTDKIELATGQAPFWDAFSTWDDIRELSHHLRPLKAESILVAFALHRQDAPLLEPDYALGQLVETGLSPETLAMTAKFCGYDLVDKVMSSALFDAADAQRVKELLEQDDPSQAPLFRVSVWSSGAVIQRQNTISASR